MITESENLSPFDHALEQTPSRRDAVTTLGDAVCPASIPVNEPCAPLDDTASPFKSASSCSPEALAGRGATGSPSPALVRYAHESPASLSSGLGLGIPRGGLTIQPVCDVPAYLATRQPQQSYVGEECLLITLPTKVQTEVKALVRACNFAWARTLAKISVQSACAEACRVFTAWNWKLKTFRAKFDLWLAAKDWIVLVNRAKAPASWRNGQTGLPDTFLNFVASRFGQFKREDGKRQALFSIKRQWQTGRNEHGDEEIIPGYAAEWSKRDRHNYPTGWSYSNIIAQIKQRAKFTAPVRALIHDSTAAATQFLPQVLGTRKNLRWLEKVTFDDVRTDWLIFNPVSGQAEEMWVLVARDEATAMVLGFVMLPATIREDGKATHLGAQQMKELAGYLLQTYPLPPYTVNWVVERGTATLAEAVRLALGELFGQRIAVHYTSMIGNKSPNGYGEKKKGNSRGKASHESHNRLFHTRGSFVGGQTGNRWDIRPSELNARIAEAREIHLRAQDLPEHLRAQVKYPLPTPAKARDLFRQFCLDQNFRTDHKLEDFEDVVEVFVDGKWQPVSELPQAQAGPFRKRKEMPVERAMRLIRAVDKWDQCSPDIITSFLEHTVRTLSVTDGGEIKLTVDGKQLTFAPPAGADGQCGIAPPVPGRKALGYLHPQDPQFLHVTSGDGRFYGTWYLRGRTEYQDRAALEQAMRYTQTARKAALATARELAASEIAQLTAMRDHNAALSAFEVTGLVPECASISGPNAVGAAIASTKQEKRAMKKQQREEQNFVDTVGAAAAADIFKKSTRDDSE